MRHAIAWMSHKNTVKGNKPDTKGQILYELIYIRYLEYSN